MATYTYRLPWPPSANTHWRRAGHTIHLSRQGREFRAAVVDSVKVPPRLSGRVRVSIELTPPTQRKLDIDNRVKPVLDALERAGVLLDDEQVDELIVRRLPVEAPGCADVVIQEDR